MAVNGKYSNQRTDVTIGDGDASRVTIAATVGVGVDYPCRGAFVQATVGNTDPVRMNINTAATTNLGIQVPEIQAGVDGTLFLWIDNINKLFFFGTNDDTVDILAVR